MLIAGGITLGECVTLEEDAIARVNTPRSCGFAGARTHLRGAHGSEELLGRVRQFASDLVIPVDRNRHASGDADDAESKKSFDRGECTPLHKRRGKSVADVSNDTVDGDNNSKCDGADESSHEKEEDRFQNNGKLLRRFRCLAIVNNGDVRECFCKRTGLLTHVDE